MFHHQYFKLSRNNSQPSFTAVGWAYIIVASMMVVAAVLLIILSSLKAEGLIYCLEPDRFIELPIYHADHTSPIYRYRPWTTDIYLLFHETSHRVQIR